MTAQSVNYPNRSDFGNLSSIKHLELLSLSANLGHQRAIAVGLCELELREDFDGVVVMDSDGEDRPEEIGGLIESCPCTQGTRLLSAQRIKEKRILGCFGFFISLYKLAFRVLTGEVIDFGNFCIIPSTLTASPDPHARGVESPGGRCQFGHGWRYAVYQHDAEQRYSGRSFDESGVAGRPWIECDFRVHR